MFRTQTQRPVDPRYPSMERMRPLALLTPQNKISKERRTQHVARKQIAAL